SGKVSARRPGTCWPRSTRGLPKALTRPTSETRERCWTSYLQRRDDVGMRPSSAHWHFVSKLYRRMDKRETCMRAPHHRDDDVPRDGYDVLAGTGRSAVGRPAEISATQEAGMVAQIALPGRAGYQLVDQLTVVDRPGGMNRCENRHQAE